MKIFKGEYNIHRDSLVSFSLCEHFVYDHGIKPYPKLHVLLKLS
jgi:hypothetical protein